MIPKILTGVALAFAVIGLIIKLVSVSVPHFVDVHLIADIDDLADDNVIAGVGVYQSIYDPTGDGLRDIAAAEGLPVEVIESDSLDFPLLFPAQTNFQSELLPVGADEAVALDAILESGTTAQDILNPVIEGVEALEFDNCATYRDDALTANNAYFNAVEDQLLPIAVTGITSTLAEELNPGLASIQAGISNAASAPALVTEGALLLIFFETATGNSNCNGLLNENNTMDAFLLGCIAGGVQAALDNGLNLTVTGSFVEHFNNVFQGSTGETIVDTFTAAKGTISFVPGAGGGALDEAPVFAVGAPDICSTTLVCANKQEYLEFVEDMLQENFDPTLVGNAANDQLGLALSAVQPYLLLIDTPILDVTDDFLVVLEVAPSIGADTLFPATFGSPYQPCGILEVFDALQPQFNVFGEADGCDSFRVFLPGVANTLIAVDNDLKDLVSTIVASYLACDGAGAPLGSPVGGFCVEQILSPGLLGIILGVDPSATFNDDFVVACEDDDEDNEAVATAQILVGLSATLNVLTVIVIIVSFFVLPKVVGPVAAGISILAGIFLISGLLIVRGAPVYEGVGEEPNGVDLEAIFVEGYVAVLALVDALLSFFAAGLLIAAAITSCLCGEESEEGDYDEDKEKVQNVEDQL